MSLRLAMRRALQWHPIRLVAVLPRRYIFVAIALFFFFTFFLLDGSGGSLHIFEHDHPPNRMPHARALLPLAERVSCFGPRGLLLVNSPDDALQYGDLETPYPVPFTGSQRDLGVDLTWMTADGRYGPYGYGERKETYTRRRVDWDRIDWGYLQDSCDSRNAERFPQKHPSAKLAHDVRFTLRRYSKIKLMPKWDEFNSTRRTALVLRAYQDFAYTPEDMWFIRSLITEAALGTGAEYSVVLLVHIQDAGRNIFASKKNYQKAFEEANIPVELQSIALLWDDNLLESWYPAISEHRTMWQVNQPMQLFALHYPEYDHYWQIELDQRFLGDAGKYLDAVSAFARNEPRKQSLERSTFSFSEQVSGSYANFTAAVDAANAGRSAAWGPVRIPDITPIGPDAPWPVTDDRFNWGVGEDADVIVTSFCRDIRTAEWLFRDYISGFELGVDTPRWWCPPAVSRASRTLLLAVHASQHRRGLSIPSEAVFPTWALWHGLKLSYPPQPAYMHTWDPSSEFVDETSRLPAEWHNDRPVKWFGYAPEDSPDGFSSADPNSFADRGLTWWWVSNYPREIMDAWLANNASAEGMPAMLATEGGKVYAPNFAMHPVKT